VKRLPRISLPIQILIAIVLAIVVGLFFGDTVAWLGPIGDGYVMLLKMSILPYIVAALILGIGSLRAREAIRLVKLGGIFMITIWAIVIATLFALTLVFPERNPAYYYAARAAETGGPESYLQLFIPGNPFFSLANNIVPAVVVFCLFFGAAVMLVKRELREPFLHMLEVAVQALARITSWVIRLAPIGVFALVGHTMGTVSLVQLEKLEIYLICFVAASAFFTFLALPMLVTSLTRIRYGELMKIMQAPILLAFATGNIFVSLPYIMAGIEKLADRYGFLTEDTKKVSKTLVPIAYNLPLVGNLMAMFFILFLSFFYSIDFTPFDKLHLIAASIFTLAGPVTAGLNSVAFLVDALHLPHDGIALFAETFSVTRNLQGLAGSMGIATFAILALCAFTKHIRFQIGRLIVNIVIALAILIALLFLIRWVEPTPHFTKPIFPELRIESNIEATVYRPGDPLPPPLKRDPAVSLLAQIRDTGQLRVGYSPEVIPYAHFNAYGQLVGYDIQLAYDLAESFQWQLTFVPFTFDSLATDIQAGKFDIAVSAISVTAERLEEMAFTSPTSIVEVVFIVLDYERLDYANLAKVAARDDLTLGVLRGSALTELAERKFPNAHIVFLDSVDDFPKNPSVDAVLWTDKEGLAWVLINQQYTIVEPAPPIQKVYYAFAVPLGAETLLDRVNYWIELRRLDGSLKEAEDKWVEGKPEVPVYRWSIMRNVLGW
jgi:Na+/H+-dicarboxylate symporter/ABC-type amino acid transport substrate-binding protein